MSAWRLVLLPPPSLCPLALSRSLSLMNQDEPYQDSLSRLAKTIQLAHAVNPNLAFEVFVHKACRTL